MEDKEIILEKKIECILGIILLIPALLNILSFIVMYLYYIFSRSASDGFLSHLNQFFLFILYSSSGKHPPFISILWGILAIGGIYLIKGSLRYLLKK